MWIAALLPHSAVGNVEPMGSASDDRALNRRRFLRGTMMLLPAGVVAGCANAEEPVAKLGGSPAAGNAVLYRQVGCGCCATYATYLRENGFSVRMETVDDLTPVREEHNLPDAAVGCHTTLVDGYVIEGHVPVEAINRVLKERPSFDGISVVGMPVNSPGMGEPNGQPLDIVSFKDGSVADFMSVSRF